VKTISLVVPASRATAPAICGVRGSTALRVPTRAPPSPPTGRSLGRTKTGGRWYRYDHIWATDDVEPIDMEYEYDSDVSDHALVTVSVAV
jgi:hypothetical protein